LEWLHQGCDSDLSADFLNFGASNFLLKFLLKKRVKIVFFSLWCRDPVVELPACVVLLSFAAGSRKQYWSDCIKAATVICQQIFSILALAIFF